MPRRNADLIVDEDPPSSPAHPSHHNRVNPYAQASAQVKRNLKRSATTASLPSPPATTSKRRQYTRPVSDTEDDDVEKTPTKATRTTRRTAAAHESPDNTTPKGKTIAARGRAETNTGTSPALTSLSVRGRSRSPTPVSNDQPLPPPSLLSRLSGAQRALIEEDETESEEESDVAPATPKRDVTPPPTRRTRSTTRNDPIRDSPNNPFLTSGDTPPRRPKVRNDELPLHERDTFTMVYRGMRTVVVNPYKEPSGSRGRLSPSHEDYSPSAEFVPKLLFPTSPTPASRTRRGAAASPTRAAAPKAPVKSIARNIFAVEIAEQDKKAKGKGKTEPKVEAEEDLFTTSPIVVSTTAGGWATSSSSSRSSSVSESQGVHNVKAKALKEGIKRGAMSGSMVIAHTTGPVRGHAPLERQDTFEGKKTGRVAAPKVDVTLTAEVPASRTRRAAAKVAPSPRR